MTLTRHRGSGPAGVLRDVTLDAAPRVLMRQRAGSEDVSQASLGARPSAPQPEAAEPTPLAAEFVNGYDAGFARGLAAGTAEGLRQGIAQGTAQGFEEGFAVGREQGYAAGESAGRDAGLASAAREAEEARAQAGAQQAQWQERASALVAQLQGERAAICEAAESDVVELVMAAICRIAGEGAINRDGARAMIRNAMHQASAVRVMRVRVHPDDHGWLDAGETSGDPVWVADSTVSLGGCIVETDAGTLDARLETQLEAVKNALRDVRAARAAAARSEEGRTHA